MKTLLPKLQPSRRTFIQAVGTGLVVAVTERRGRAQVEEAPAPRAGRNGRGGRGGGGAAAPGPLTARIRIDKDGAVTVLSGKVECGQGARAEIAQAAAEELRLPLTAVTVLLCDTDATPNDGGTFGSATTPRTLPVVRQAAAAMRQVLIDLAAARLSAPAAELAASAGKIHHAPSNRDVSYGDLAASDDAQRRFAQPGAAATLTPTADWKIMGNPALRHDAADMVTGRHAYPTDITRPGMVYGKILRPPAYDATLQSLDESVLVAMPSVKLVRSAQLAGVIAPSTFAADNAIAALAPTAKWSGGSSANSATLAADLRATIRNGIPANPFADVAAAAPNRLTQTYFIPYVQHAPLEPRTAVAEWDASGKLTVWTASQNPFGVRSELARAFSISEASVRVVIPDFGGGFGGKHTGECAVEAATLAKSAGKPVMLRWSRAEEFTWAYFRPAAVIDIDASLDAAGKITSWHFININSGNAGLDSPYTIAQKRSQYVSGTPPLRHGSYRGLAATANNFAREVAMDELAAMANKDPVAFRVAHLDDPRLRNALQKAADLFGWSTASAAPVPNSGIGIACGVEKGSYVATATALHVAEGKIVIDRIVHTFECGAIVNPLGLRQQVTGAIVQGLGPALFESIAFANGIVTNAAFAKYRVPRFADLPPLHVELMDRKDLPSAGAGETPLISLAPALANALSAATQKRHRSLPLTLA